jgi:hypothetical protein
MHESYKDITSRIAEPPKWYDQNGAPRYDDFNPELCPNIYAHHVGLFLIECQECDQKFEVEMHADVFDSRMKFQPSKWHYGDPPAHGCVGDTMNCEDLAVLQFWGKEPFGDWERLPKFEGPIG